MAVEYGYQVTNKFGLMSDTDDENDDPRRLIDKVSLIAANKKEEEKTVKPTQPVKEAAPSVPAKSENTRGRGGRGRGRGGAGRPRDGNDNGDRFGENRRGGPRRGGERGERGAGRPGRGRGGFVATNKDEASKESSFEEGQQDQVDHPRRRGGFTLGGSGGRGGGRGRGRQHDRQSGSDRTGVRAFEKKEGHGKGNWGDQKDELIGETENIAPEENAEPEAPREKTAEELSYIPNVEPYSRCGQGGAGGRGRDNGNRWRRGGRRGGRWRGVRFCGREGDHPRSHREHGDGEGPGDGSRNEDEDDDKPVSVLESAALQTILLRRLESIFGKDHVHRLEKDVIMSLRKYKNRRAILNVVQKRLVNNQLIDKFLSKLAENEAPEYKDYASSDILSLANLLFGFGLTRLASEMLFMSINLGIAEFNTRCNLPVILDSHEKTYLYCFQLGWNIGHLFVAVQSAHSYYHRPNLSIDQLNQVRKSTKCLLQVLKSLVLTPKKRSKLLKKFATNEFDS